MAFRFYERDEHRIGAPVGRQLAPECERAHIVLFLGFRMVELGSYHVCFTLTTPSDTRPPHAGSAAVAFNTCPMYAHTRHTSPTPPHYLATRLLLLDCCTRRFRPYTAPIQWPDGSARPPNCPPRLLCIVPASTAPPGVSRRLSVEEVPATPAMALMVMVVHLLQRGVLRRSETEFCAVRSAHASREVLDRSLSCGRSVDAIGTLQRLMSTASVLEHRAHQQASFDAAGAPDAPM